MAATATKDSDRLAGEEAGLARAAATGDGSALAALYRRYEQRAFNLAYRIGGSEADAAEAVQDAFLRTAQMLPRLVDGEPDFSSHLFAATHKACLERSDRRQRRQAIQASNGSAGSNGARPETSSGGTPSPRQDELREANMRLPERQREALALRELEQLSYAEIAAIMETNADMVAQLLARARINLCDELQGTVLASVGAPSPQCERALPLLTMREDRELEDGSSDATWLDAHLAGCERCRLGVTAMQDASSSYRIWEPIAAAPGLFREAMASAAALAGVDWSGEVAGVEAGPAPAESPGTLLPFRRSAGGGRRPRHRLTLASGLATLLLLGGLAAALARNNPPSIPAKPTAGTGLGSTTRPPNTQRDPAAKARRHGAKSASKTQTVAARTAVGTTGPAARVTAGPQAAPPGPLPSQTAPSSGQSGPGRKAAVQPGQPTSTPKPSAKPLPSPAPTAVAQPAAVAVPESTESPPAEESPAERHRRREPPGKPPDRPPR